MTLRFGTESRLDSLSEAAAVDFAAPGAVDRYAPDLRLEPIHRAIDIDLDLEGKTLVGSVVITVRARAEGRSLTLDAVDLDIQGVRDLDDHRLDWDEDGEHIAIRWAHAVEPGQTRRVEVRWSVQAPLTGLHFSWPDETDPDRPRFAVTDHETERARHWLPCVDHPQARPTVELAVRTAWEWTVLGPGRMDGVELAHEDGTKTVRWALDQPCPSYLLCFAVGEFVEVDLGKSGTVPLKFFATVDHSAADVRRSFSRTRRMMGFLTQHLDCAFPYPKYFQFAVPGIGGAMENISLTSWDDKFLGDEALHAEIGWLVDLVNLHEMAHTWFGDALVCKEFAHVWLKESWATYLESVWLEATEGEESMQWQLHEELREYRSEADSRYQRPISTRRFDHSWDMFDRHLYPGGAVRLHMLRKELGDELFWRGVRSYVAEHLHGTVETDDFRRSLESASGRNLGRFFDQWFRSPGYPRLKVTRKHDSEAGELQLTFEQTQVDAAAGVPVFAFSLPVWIERSKGEWARYAVTFDEDAAAALTVPCPRKPRQVLLNPELAAVCSFDFRPGGDQLRRSLVEAPTIFGRIQAASALARSGARRDVAALATAAAKEPHFGVRIAIVRALGRTGTQGAIDALIGRLRDEPHARVQQWIPRACARYRDPAMTEALTAFVAREDIGPTTRMEALAALGEQRDRAPLAVLEAWVDSRSPWSRAARGALSGLAGTRTAAGVEVLLTRLEPGSAPTAARTMACQALGSAASTQERDLRRRAREALEDRLRDPEYAVRMAAAMGLRALGDRRAAGALDEVGKLLAAQDRPRVERMLRALRKRGPDATGRQLDELAATVRRLEGRLRKVEARRS